MGEPVFFAVKLPATLFLSGFEGSVFLETSDGVSVKGQDS